LLNRAEPIATQNLKQALALVDVRVLDHLPWLNEHGVFAERDLSEGIEVEHLETRGNSTLVFAGHGIISIRS
jgi:hypothetical protein